MGFEELLVSILIEGFFLLLVLAIFFFIRYRKIARQLAAPGKPLSGQAHASVSVDFLSNEIQRTSAKQENINKNSAGGMRLFDVCNFRLNILKAEQKAFEESKDNDKAFWPTIITAFESIIDDEVARGVAEKNQEIEQLNNTISNYEKRVGNLEKFKGLFFDLGDKLKQSQRTIDKLSEYIQENIESSKRSKELEALLVKVEEEKNALAGQLDMVDTEFLAMMRNLEVMQSKQYQIDLAGEVDFTHPVQDRITEKMGGPIPYESDNVEQMRNVIETQKARIAELNDMVDSLKLESGQSDAVKNMISELETKGKEMSNIIEVLEEENTFLQVQIQELLKQETEGTYQFQERLTELQELVLDKDKAYNALEAKFADMESRYLEVFEELQNKR